MFSEDIGLLPGKFFTRALEDASTGGEAYGLLFGLFREMNTPGVTAGGRYRGTPYFNGGIFEAVEPFELTPVELDGCQLEGCLLYTSPSPRDRTRYRMPSSA